MSSVSRMARVYGVAMADDRRRPLRDEELARIARAIDPRARATYSAPILGGLDAATYALDIDIGGERRELVARIFTLPVHRDGAAARRYWKAISGIPVDAPVLVPRPVYLDSEGALVGLPCMVMTRLPGTPLARPANEDSWIDQLAGAVASIHDVDVTRLPADYARGPNPVELVEKRLTYWSPKILKDLWRDAAGALRSAAPRVISNGTVLTHGDFWFGNTLWSDERLTGIVDWDDAQINDPGFDIGYARGDLQLVHGGNAPDRFLAGYEARRGKIRSIAFWDLVSTLPAFRWLDDWAEGYREVGRSEISDDLARHRFAAFVRSALGAL
jgi:aminoglycoside phosphotransferase (APT) family kinase protein